MLTSTPNAKPVVRRCATAPSLIPRPQPFSSRHDGYLARYVEGGPPRILNSRRAVVGLTKQRALVPLSLVVVKISGEGPDGVFLSVIRRAESGDPSSVRVRG